MTFGYNAAAAFGQSTAEVIDHAKSLLASLVDKREKPEVQNNDERGSEEDIDTGLGDSTSSNVHCILSRRNRGQASTTMPEDSEGLVDD